MAKDKKKEEKVPDLYELIEKSKKDHDKLFSNLEKVINETSAHAGLNDPANKKNIEEAVKKGYEAYEKAIDEFIYQGADDKAYIRKFIDIKKFIGFTKEQAVKAVSNPQKDEKGNQKSPREVYMALFHNSRNKLKDEFDALRIKEAVDKIVQKDGIKGVRSEIKNLIKKYNQGKDGGFKDDKILNEEDAIGIYQVISEYISTQQSLVETMKTNPQVNEKYFT